MTTDRKLLNINDNELIMLYREENEEAKVLLYEKYKYVINYLIKKNKKYFDDLKIDMQEVYSECALGLSYGLSKYNENEKASLLTFIILCIERRINVLLNKYKSNKYKEIQNAYSLEFLDDDNVEFIERISDFAYEPLKNIIEDEGVNELFKHAENVLSKKEYNVFLFMINGYKCQDIAKLLNENYKNIENTIYRVKNKIKKRLVSNV